MATETYRVKSAGLEWEVRCARRCVQRVDSLSRALALARALAESRWLRLGIATCVVLERPDGSLEVARRYGRPASRLAPAFAPPAYG